MKVVKFLKVALLALPLLLGQFHGFVQIQSDTLSVGSHMSEIAHRLRITLIGSEVEPSGSLPAVLDDTVALEEEVSHGDLRIGIPVLGLP